MAKTSQQPLFRMPIIVRARGYRLYDRYNKRYLDLYQNNGRAILGHRVDTLQRTLKSTVNRGLLAEYPSIYDGRLEKILKLMFTDYPNFRIYKNRERAMVAISHAVGKGIYPEDIADPAMKTLSKQQRIAFWRPFLSDLPSQPRSSEHDEGTAPEQARPDFLLPILPFPGGFAPEVVCVKRDSLAEKMPPSDMISPFLVDGTVKVLSKLIKASHGINREGSEFQRLIDVFEWNRRGPYINTGLDQVAYTELFKRALNEGILLPPSEKLPIIIPREFSEGELAGFTYFVQTLSGE